MDTATSRRSWWLMVMDHNPFYLLSGAMMLVGCYLLNAALYTKAGDVGRLVALLGVINLYEALLVGLGLALIRRAAFVRDGRILLGLEALFLVDITFTNGVISTVDARWGMVVGAGLLAVAGVKVWVILRALKLPEAGRMWGFIVMQLAAILVGPAIFKQVAARHYGMVSASVVYGAYVVAGAMLTIGAGMWRRGGVAGEREMGIGRLFVVLPVVSLLVHLYSAAWVYSVPFTYAYAGPVILGLAVVVGRLGRGALRWQMALVVLGVWVSIGFPSGLLMHLSRGVDVSPLRVALLGAGVIVLHGLWRENWVLAGVVASFCVVAAMLGPSLPVIWANLVESGFAMAGLGKRLTPRTTFAWGVCSVGMAFAMLGVGAGVTWWRERRIQP